MNPKAEISLNRSHRLWENVENAPKTIDITTAITLRMLITPTILAEDGIFVFQSFYVLSLYKRLRCYCPYCGLFAIEIS